VKQCKAENFFTAAELERIRQAVNAAESHTSGEIATMIVAESDRYPEAEQAGSLFLAAFAGLVIAVATQHLSVWSYIPLVVLLYFPALVLFRKFPRLKLPFVARGRIAEAVRLRAVRAFYEKGLYRTRHETGILIFMSLAERKVWILGDRGINERIDPSSWEGMAVSLARGIAEGSGCDALCEVIGRCGAELSRHFPRQLDDVNELDDSLLIK
jgi:putative membrane protein